MNLAQILAVTRMSLRGAPQRLGASLVMVLSVASVVAVTVSLLAITAGLTRISATGDRHDRAIALSDGISEYMGAFSRDQAAVIAEAPGIRKDAAGHPMVQPIALVVVELRKKNGGWGNAVLRGTGPVGWAMNPSLHLVEGRMYRPGLFELVVGDAAAAQFAGLKVGGRVNLNGVDWAVVGRYSANGGIAENALLADVETVQTAFHRNAYQSFDIGLESPSALGRVQKALEADPRLKVKVLPLQQYYAQQLQQLTSAVNFVAYFVGAIMAIGAIFASVNAMYASVDARAREIATLRAIGFGSGSAVASVMLESLLLAVPGALVGAGLAWLAFNDHPVSTQGVRFPLTVTPDLVVTGVVLSLVVGFLGAIAPAVRAATTPVASALRAG